MTYIFYYNMLCSYVIYYTLNYIIIYFYFIFIILYIYTFSQSKDLSWKNTVFYQHKPQLLSKYELIAIYSYSSRLLGITDYLYCS